MNLCISSDSIFSGFQNLYLKIIVFSLCFIVDLDLPNLKKVHQWLTNYRRDNLYDEMFTESEYAQYKKDLTEIKNLIDQVEQKYNS